MRSKSIWQRPTLWLAVPAPALIVAGCAPNTKKNGELTNVCQPTTMRPQTLKKDPKVPGPMMLLTESIFSGTDGTIAKKPQVKM